ncbi:MAG: hypothetical protein H0U66_15135 [Gemmatimonadaceae bacterium]|nr:hypothetical protein [Gemmatimonadaceae bacterium]
MLRKLFAAIAIAGVLAGCGRHRINDDIAADNASTLEVVNHHWSDVDIYVIRDGQRLRVGQVTASADQHFVLQKSMTSGGGTLQLQAHAVGSNGAISSETITARPGGMQLTWTLENNLTRATLAFY